MIREKEQTLIFDLREISHPVRITLGHVDMRTRSDAAGRTLRRILAATVLLLTGSAAALSADTMPLAGDRASLEFH